MKKTTTTTATTEAPALLPVVITPEAVNGHAAVEAPTALAPFHAALEAADFLFRRTEPIGAGAAHGYAHKTEKRSAAVILDAHGLVAGWTLRYADGGECGGKTVAALLKTLSADKLVSTATALLAPKVEPPLSKAALRSQARQERILEKQKAASRANVERLTAIAEQRGISYIEAFEAEQPRIISVREVVGAPDCVLRAVEMLAGITPQFDVAGLRGDKHYGHRLALLKKLYSRDRVLVAETGVNNLTQAFYTALGVPEGSAAARATAFAARCTEMLAKAVEAPKLVRRAERRVKRLMPPVVVPGTILPAPKRKSRTKRAAEDLAARKQLLTQVSAVEPEAKPQPDAPLLNYNPTHLQAVRHKNGDMSLLLERWNSQGALHMYDNGRKVIVAVLTPVLVADVRTTSRSEAVESLLTMLDESKSEKSEVITVTLRRLKAAVERSKEPLTLAPAPALTEGVAAPRTSAAEVKINPAAVRLLEDPDLGLVLMQLEKENSQGAICVYNNGVRVSAGIVKSEVLRRLRPIQNTDVVKAAHQFLNPINAGATVTPVAAGYLTAVEHCKEIIAMEATKSTAKKFEAPKTDAKKTTAATPKASKGAAVKAAHKKAAGGGGNRLTDEQTITVVAKENPYTEGSKAAKTFALFAKAKTVGDFKKLAADKEKYEVGYVRYASRDGYIKIK